MAQRGKNNLRKDVAEFVDRPDRISRYSQLFLIVCEDENTEPAYFNRIKDELPELPDETMFVKCVGTGRDQLGVVQQAVTERETLATLAEKKVDYTWVVFDKDDADENETKLQRFADAFELAKKENIDIALSNEVFEVWLLLHLAELSPEAPIPRATIYEQLQAKIRELEGHEDFIYAHGSADILTKIDELGDEAAATERAKDLEVHFAETSLIDANPSTRVYRLVELLREWVVYYSWEPRV